MVHNAQIALFYGYLLCVARNCDLLPLFELYYYHPDYKGLHCKMPCKTSLNHSNHLLVRGRELNLKASRDFDPRSEHDRIELMRIFCTAVGIE